MQEKTQKYHPGSVRLKWFFLLLLIGFSFQLKAQTLTFEQACAELDRRMENSKEPTITALYYFRDLGKGEFKDQKDWYRTLNYIEVAASKSHGNYYAQICSEIGGRLHNHGQYQDAYYYLYKAQTEIQLHPPKDERFLTWHYQSLGLSYYYFKRFDEARKQILLANSAEKMHSHDRIGMLNTLGLINRDQGYGDSARIYFETALNLAKATSDKPWIGVLSGNLGQYYWTRRDYTKARKLIELDYKTSKETGQPGSAFNALALLIEIDLASNKLADAREKLTRLENMRSDSYFIQENSVFYRAKTAVQEATGDYKGALESYRKVVRYNDTISRHSDRENLQKTEFQIDFERKQAEISLLQEKEKRNDIIIYGLAGISIALIIVFAIIINLIAKRRRREKEISTLKQNQVEQELESTEKQMHAMLTNLIEKNQLIEQLTEEVNQFQSSNGHEMSDEKMKMIDKLQSFTLLTDDDWLEFKKLFEKLNPNFFNRVLMHSPDLTNAEIRLITLIKLNLSNLEMSRALGISPDSVRKTSLRLRKKLNMELQEELVKFILSL